MLESNRLLQMAFVALLALLTLVALALIFTDLQGWF